MTFVVCVCAIPNSQYAGIRKGVEMSIVLSEGSIGHRMKGLPYISVQIDSETGPDRHLLLQG